MRLNLLKKYICIWFLLLITNSELSIAASDSKNLRIGITSAPYIEVRTQDINIQVPLEQIQNPNRYEHSSRAVINIKTNDYFTFKIQAPPANQADGGTLNLINGRESFPIAIDLFRDNDGIFSEAPMGNVTGNPDLFGDEGVTFRLVDAAVKRNLAHLAQNGINYGFNIKYDTAQLVAGDYNAIITITAETVH